MRYILEKTLVCLLFVINFSFITNVIIAQEKDLKLTEIFKVLDYQDESTTNKLLLKDLNVKEVKQVEINLELLQSLQSIKTSVLNEVIEIHDLQINKRFSDTYSIVGKVNKYGNIVISKRNSDLNGVILTGKTTYQIITFQKKYFLQEINNCKIKDEGDDVVIMNDNLNLLDESDYELLTKSFSSYNNCNIRLAVLYTPLASAQVSDIVNTIYTSIELTNQSFDNSNIQAQVDLAYIGETNYTEYSNGTDLNRFMNLNDGYMDEIANIRNFFTADICVLITHSYVTCGGVSPAIDANVNQAYCLANVNCATYALSFHHEIGHLLGCRHDPFIDNSSYPYQYGHGYVYLPSLWRTIMAYNNECDCSDEVVPCPPSNQRITDGYPYCTRINYWSSPDIRYNNIQMGTSQTHDCAKVIRQEVNEKALFRQPLNNVVITSSEIANLDFGYVVSQDPIVLNSTNPILPNKTLVIGAEEIILGEGFTISNNSELKLINNIIETCQIQLK